MEFDKTDNVNQIYLRTEAKKNGIFDYHTYRLYMILFYLAFYTVLRLLYLFLQPLLDFLNNMITRIIWEIITHATSEEPAFMILLLFVAKNTP